MINKDNYVYRVVDGRLKIKVFDREVDMINFLKENQEEQWECISGFSIDRIY